MKRREYRLQVLNVKFWKVEEYREGKLLRQFGCFPTKRMAEEVVGSINSAIQAFMEDNNL